MMMMMMMMMKELNHLSSTLLALNKVVLATLFSQLKYQFHLLHIGQQQRKFSSTIKRQQAKCVTTKALVSQFLYLQRKGGASSIDSYALLRVLKASSRRNMEGKQIHAIIINLGFEPIVFLQTALMDMYSEMGNVNDAHRIFDEMPQRRRTVVCWTALISTYVHNGRPNKALELFRRMQAERVEPDRVAMTIALSACADVGALDSGEWIHAYIRRKQGLGGDLILSNAIINMYAKCGDIEAAQRVFERAKQRDVTTWTSMIVGHALHGQAEDALRLFAEMINNGDGHPNSVTFVGVLMACSHAGLVEEGWRYWESMRRGYGLKPGIGHYGCMVDLLCRAGLLSEAYDFIMSMPIRPNAVIWRTLLGACGLHGNISLGTHARRRLLELEPGHAGDDVAISNAYAAAGLWDEKQKQRRKSRRRAPGCSLIEVENRVHEFVTSDRRHIKTREIQEVLWAILENSKASSVNNECFTRVFKFC